MLNLRVFVRRFIAAIYGQCTKKSIFNRLRVIVALNNAHRRILDFLVRCSAGGMYATYGIFNFKAIIGKQ